MGEGDLHETTFWNLIAEIQRDDPRVEEGTIMGGRCARVQGEFLALVDFKGSGLVVKLPRERVAELIEEGHGDPFAPAGRRFREWAAIAPADEANWPGLIEDAFAHVAALPPPRPKRTRTR